MKCQVCVLALAAVANACQHEILHSESLYGLEKRLVNKGQEQPVLSPKLDENESVLLNSFDATDIDTWAYYYTHGLHVAGTNKSMAQWTADHFAENGFAASLASYGQFGPLCYVNEYLHNE